MDVVLVSSEVAPFSKTGGLGDAVAALAKALARAGHRVWTVSPRYRGSAPGATYTGHTVTIPLGGFEQRAGLHRLGEDGVEHLFVDHAVYDREGLYGDGAGTYGDNHLRFALLCQAALHATRLFASDDVVIHAHDWQAALVPIYLEAAWRPVGLLRGAGTVLTLHNPAHQGRTAASAFADLELAARWFRPWALEFHGDLGLLKGGILHADEVTTVSPTFAREIVTPGGGFGLEAVLAARPLTGILNGIDGDEWNPADDRETAAPFDASDLAGKAVCKAALQAELNLPIDGGVPLVGWVGRLDPQKGVSLALESLPWLAGEQGVQFVALGSAAVAHQVFEQRLRELEREHPHQVRNWIGYSEPVAHRIIAGADLFLMPSVFEPCGLTQMYAQRYGTVPVVRRTGGLADSVEPIDVGADSGTGIVFDLPTGHALRDALWAALSLFRDDPGAFERAALRGMSRDFSWDRRVPEYVAIYERARAARALEGTLP
jgi:starch synthase